MDLTARGRRAPLTQEEDIAANEHAPAVTAAPPSTTGDREPTEVLRNRGVPNKMGTVRLGNSGRPFPIIASDAHVCSYGGAITSGDDNTDGRVVITRPECIASGTGGPVAPGQKRHVSIEYRVFGSAIQAARSDARLNSRRYELPSSHFLKLCFFLLECATQLSSLRFDQRHVQKLIFVPEESERERFQVRKSIINSLPHKRKLQGDQNAKQHHTEREQPKRADSASLSHKKRGISSTTPSFPKTTELQALGGKEIQTDDGSSSHAKRVVRESLVKVEDARHMFLQRPPSIVTNYDPHRDFSASTQAISSYRSNDALTAKSSVDALKQADPRICHDGISRIVSGNPVDLHLLAQRTEEHNTSSSASKCFHTAFHEHSTIGYSVTNQSHHHKNENMLTSQLHASPATIYKTPWREVDESIEHIYEDPSTDFVQLKLLHRSSENSKRQKLLERERVLAAASGLREREQREREQFDALQRKKMQVEQLSEAIRLRNKKLISKSEPDSELIDKPTGAAATKRVDGESGEPKRKPPVPRQHGRRKEQSQTRNARLKEMTEAITLQIVQRSAPPPTAVPEVRRTTKKEKSRNNPGSVSSSILLGDSSEFVQKDVRQSIGEESHESHEGGDPNPPPGSPQEVVAVSTPGQHIEEKQKPPPKRPRSTRKANRPIKYEEPELNHVVPKEKTERRELAREYMELQKQSRKMHHVKEKQRRELETQKRRLQLEKLEQERIDILRRSKKANFKRSRNAFGSEKGHHSPQREFPRRGAAEKEFGIPTSEDGADDIELRGVAHDEDHQFIASDQENQRNNRNRMHDRSTDLHGFSSQHSGYDASVLIGYPSADGKHSPMAAAVAAPKEIDVRLRRLLELEEKTLKLSMVVSGMKLQKRVLQSTRSHVQAREENEKAFGGEDGLYVSISKRDAYLHDGREYQFDKLADSGGEYEDDAVSVDREEKHEHSDDGESVLKRFDEVQEELSNDSGDDQSAPDETSDREEDNESEEHRIADARLHMSMNTEEVRPPTSASIAVDTATSHMDYIDGAHEFDLRSIGVHNIKVEWPMEHHSDDGDAGSGGGSSPKHSSSASSSASPRSDLHFDREQLLFGPRESLGSDQSSHSTDQFEASIHAYMQQRHLRDQTEMTNEDAEQVNTSSHSSSHAERDEIAPMRAFLTPPSTKTTEANEAFLRMVREADDSLSVINSTAKKIWLQQQQKLKAQAEKQRQQELEAVKLEQDLKDQQLKAVMDSLTARHVSDSDDESESEEHVEAHADPNSVESVLQFNRLEDIMREIEDERMREQQAVSVTIATAASSDSERQESDLQHGKPPASMFWNDMLANSESLTRNNSSGKSRTVIDRSELVLQQTQQQHQVEDVLFSQNYQDELKRVHSPKALARLLLAEVEYHEAIHDAHLQLSMMEQAQVVEQAQVETMNVANAFKEEMENNLTSHQLALEHAILSKQFDGDLQDVMQELETIQHAQAIELAATNAGMQNELKRANLRESTVQTDELKRADAATNAKLYAESGTSTSPHFADAAVQYETPEKELVLQNAAVNQFQAIQQPGGVPAISTTGVISVDEEAYSEEEYEEDNFERESQSVMIQDSVKKAEKSTSEMMSSGSANEIPDDDENDQESEVESKHGSDAESVSDEDELPEKLKQSTAPSTNPYEDDEIHNGEYDDDEERLDAQSDGSGSVASSAIGITSAISDGKYTSDRDNSTAQSAPASMGYEDDFDVSTSQAQAVKKSGSVDSEIADEDEGEDDEASSASIVSADDIQDVIQGESGFKESDEVASGGSAYSSKFSGSVKEEPKSKPAPKAITPQIPEQAISIEVRTRQDVAFQRLETDIFSVDLGNAGARSDDLAQAYQRDLEMRKKSDESLLLVRLQVLERKFHRDLQSIDKAIADMNASSKQQELLLRKEATKMAFLSEKANLESLRAASMARYYQDLLAFQSLMSGADSSVTIPVSSQTYLYASATPVFKERSKPAHQVPTTEFNSNEHESKTSSVQNEYDDEFDSASGKAEIKPDDDEVSENGVKSSRGSIASSKDDEEEASEIDEDDASAKESVKSEHVSEEEDAYDEEFASVSNSDARGAAQKLEDENDNVDGSIDDDFEKYSGKSETPSEEVSVAEDEIEKHSGGGKDKGEEADQESEGDYEDEFASISESGGTKPLEQMVVDDDKDEIVHKASKDGEQHGVNDDDASSQVHSENFEDDFEEDKDDDVQVAASIQDEQENETAKAEKNLLYSSDFEADGTLHEGGEDESQGLSKQLDVGGATIVVDQSGSEDSSTTKLLIEQVNQLQELTEKHSEVEVKHAEDKLARKKIKAIELVQAKERLIKMERDKFKLEEEKRQVNTLAQLAIQMDVDSELSKAKEQIKQQLEHEMATVKQTFPGFATVPDSGAKNAKVLTLDTAQSMLSKNVPASKPRVVADAPIVKPQEIAQSIKAEADPNDEYEVDSFENEQSPADNSYEEAAAYKEDYRSSFAKEESQLVEDVHANKTADEVDEAEDEIASDAEDFASVSGDGAEGSEIPSELAVDDEAESSNDLGDKAKEDAEVASDGEASVDDYAEYEDESFDEAKSATSMKRDEGDEEQRGDETKMKVTTVKDDEAASDEYNDDEYAEEEFERASEASAADLKPSPEDEGFESAEETQDAPTLGSKPDQLSNTHGQQDEVPIDHLSTALDAVTSQFHQSPVEATTNADSVDHEAHDLSVAPQVELNESSGVLPAQLSVSVSYEEEVLSKSIEEQTKRLEELKQMILARKYEILSVQKHMRVEKRKEQLTGEERLLWDEMERVEANLRMNEAALELTRQRNRLETMELEAKHSDFKAKTLNLSRPDLLEGFDFVEIAEVPDIKLEQRTTNEEATPTKSKKPVWGATSDMICQTDSAIVASLAEGFDLLTGYVYIEEVERVPAVAEPMLPTGPGIAVCEAEELEDADDSKSCSVPLADDGAPVKKIEKIDGDDQALLENEDSLRNQDASLTHETPVQLDSDAVDLLSGYSYVEAIEPTASSDEDLLASFDHVEVVDRLEYHKPSDPDSVLTSKEESGVDQKDDDFADEEIASEGDGDESAPLASPDAGDEEKTTSGGCDSPASKEAAERAGQHRTTDGEVAENSGFNLEQCRDVTDAGADNPQDLPAHREGSELVGRLTDAIYEDLFADVMKDTQEMRRQLSTDPVEEQDAGELARESDNGDRSDISEESIESISTDVDAADRLEAETLPDAETNTRGDMIQVTLAEPGAASRDMRADQLADTVFEELYAEVLSAGVASSLKKKKQRQSNTMKANTISREYVNDTPAIERAALDAVKVTASRGESMEKANRETAVVSPFAEREFVSSIIQQLEISADGVVLPAYSDVKQTTALRSARVLYEVVQDTANSILSKHTTFIQRDGVTSDQNVDIAALKQEVEVEIERILSIRSAGSDELKRQTQSLSSEMDNSQVTREDLQMMQTQFRMSVSQVADQMRRNLILAATSGGVPAANMISTSATTPRSAFYPRTPTPTSRTSSSRRPMLLTTSLLNYESAQLQERITNFILDDLLRNQEE